MGPRFPQGTAFRGAGRSGAAAAAASASEEGSSSKGSKARKQQTSVLGHSSVPAGGAVHVPASRAQKESPGKSRLSASPAALPQVRQQHCVQKMQQQKTIHHRGEQQRRQQQQRLEEGGEQKEGHKQQQQHKTAVKLPSPDTEKKKKKRMEQAGELQQQRQAAGARAEAGVHDAAGVEGDEKEMKRKQRHKKEGAVALAGGEIASKKQLLRRRRSSSAAVAVGTPSEATPNIGRGQQHQQRERLDASLGGGAAAAARKTAAAAGEHFTAAKGETTATGGISAGAHQCNEGEKDSERGTEDTEEEQNADPYLLAEADYLRSETRWVNRQRVLVLSSRGISFLQRRLMEDFKRLLPHHKAEAKWEKKQTLRDIVELAQLRACNNVLFFESRKHDLLLHVAKLPHGPTAIFRVLNIHTLGEMRLTGNCLLHSRPLLLFDPVFDSETQPHWKLLKELFVQVFGTPRNHPKAKPFFDHAMGFFKFDGNKLWFRHYQIAPLVPGSTGDANKPERQTFIEIGPRCVFEAVKILDDAFGGKTIWSNREFVPTRDMVSLQRLQTAAEYAARVKAKERREERMENIGGHGDRHSFESVFGEYVAENRRRPSKKQKLELVH